ncbi:hypothetical protein GCM10028803_40380 [Larkinella knui]|uniref:Uncharacterized protein n=1 Tax=Larkinella knui TaxID=2025310 RepID=A0A3P1CF47_9BACT|nr:hypothetical protein [Larkinella knui]RRB11878.1 hypothetical protein EHT87_25775 [Larkinella knui]
MDIIPDLVKLLIPAGLVLYGMYVTVKLMLEREAEKQRVDLKNRYASEVTPLRLQAYERMALFLERITPGNLLLRLNGQTPVALDFQQLLLREIREEYNHNVSQQIYMSQAVWEEVQNAMNEVVTLINEAAGEVAPESPALDLSKKIFDKVIQKNIQPTAAGLKAVKDEVQATFL